MLFEITTYIQNIAFPYRAVLAFITAVVMHLCFAPSFIRFQKKFGYQPIRPDGPQEHHVKQGTPTMGGILILLSFFTSAALWCDIFRIEIITISFVVFAYSMLGFVDDYIKVYKKHHGGIKAKSKLFYQFIIGLIAGYALYMQNTALGYDFYGSIQLPLGYNIRLGFLYPIFVALTTTATSNAVNLTDGLDGLAVRVVIPIIAFFTIVSCIIGIPELSHYFGKSFLAHGAEFAVLCLALIGAMLAFLWYNAKPAKIFMGDVGSLAIGGFVGITAVVARIEFFLICASTILIAESLSVIIQVYYFKMTKKRVFLMAPIHHHFEKKGWPETLIVERFAIISFISSLLALCLWM